MTAPGVVTEETWLPNGRLTHQCMCTGYKFQANIIHFWVDFQVKQFNKGASPRDGLEGECFPTF